MVKLTKLGKQVRDELKVVVNNMEGRSGDLTPLGRQQHQGIAQRMYHNYPQVFADGSAIDARSSVVTRCVLSMDAFCQELKGLNPKLIITNDASQHDMYYICKGAGTTTVKEAIRMPHGMPVMKCLPPPSQIRKG